MFQPGFNVQLAKKQFQNMTVQKIEAHCKNWTAVKKERKNQSSIYPLTLSFLSRGLTRKKSKSSQQVPLPHIYTDVLSSLSRSSSTTKHHMDSSDHNAIECFFELAQFHLNSSFREGFWRIFLSFHPFLVFKSPFLHYFGPNCSSFTFQSFMFYYLFEFKLLGFKKMTLTLRTKL